MWLPVLFLLIGISLGLLTDFHLNDTYTNYLSIALLAAFDTLIGGTRAHLEGKFDESIFVSGFFTNILLAAFLAFLGLQLGIDLYLVAVFAFGVRIFQNIAVARRILLEKFKNYKKIKKNH
ncbi:small basic family protein [Bacillaceae bacterium S4-13-58]